MGGYNPNLLTTLDRQLSVSKGVATVQSKPLSASEQRCRLEWWLGDGFTLLLAACLLGCRMHGYMDRWIDGWIAWLVVSSAAYPNGRPLAGNTASRLPGLMVTNGVKCATFRTRAPVLGTKQSVGCQVIARMQQ